MELAERLARSIQWLDTVKPGWRSEIDVARLKMDDPDDCILGQLGLWDAAFDEGSPMANDDDESRPDHAFDTYDEVLDYSYKDLQDAWTAELDSPRPVPKLPDPT